jgi:hypothetical protein
MSVGVYNGAAAGAGAQAASPAVAHAGFLGEHVVKRCLATLLPSWPLELITLTAQYLSQVNHWAYARQSVRGANSPLANAALLPAFGQPTYQGSFTRPIA